MKVKVQVIVELDNGDTQVLQEVSLLERGSLQPENLGLNLVEAKTLLKNTQRTLVEQQIAAYSRQNSFCLHCKKKLLLLASAQLSTVLYLVSYISKAIGYWVAYAKSNKLVALTQWLIYLKNVLLQNSCI